MADWGYAQVCEFAGTTYRQLDYWMRQGYLDEPARVASHTDRPVQRRGSGSTRRFTEGDAWRARRLRILVDTGLTPGQAAGMLHHERAEQALPDADRYQQQIRQAREELAGLRCGTGWPA